MKNDKVDYLIFVIVLIITTNSSLLAQTNNKKNEDEVKRFEIGGQFIVLRRVDADTVLETFRRFGLPTGNFPETLNELGLGGRFTYNFTKNIAVEAEANFSPDDKRADFTSGVPVRIGEPGGRKLQAVFGPKIGFRKNKIGLFGKIRPGFIRLDRYQVIEEVGTPDDFFTVSRVKSGLKFFNIDIGGVFEYYPTRNTVFRVDVGDTIIHYNAKEPRNINPTFTRHNLQTSVGFGFRF